MISDQLLNTIIEATAKAIVAPIDARLVALEVSFRHEIASKHRKELLFWKFVGFVMGMPGVILSIIAVLK